MGLILTFKHEAGSVWLVPIFTSHKEINLMCTFFTVIIMFVSHSGPSLFLLSCDTFLAPSGVKYSKKNLKADNRALTEKVLFGFWCFVKTWTFLYFIVQRKIKPQAVIHTEIDAYFKTVTEQTSRPQTWCEVKHSEGSNMSVPGDSRELPELTWKHELEKTRRPWRKRKTKTTITTQSRTSLQLCRCVRTWRETLMSWSDAAEQSAAVGLNRVENIHCSEYREQHVVVLV